jgi:hypothetical protein
MQEEAGPLTPGYRLLTRGARGIECQGLRPYYGEPSPSVN